MSDYQVCEHCGDSVYGLSSRGWCDGCEAEPEAAVTEARRAECRNCGHWSEHHDNDGCTLMLPSTIWAPLTDLQCGCPGFSPVLEAPAASCCRPPTDAMAWERAIARLLRDDDGCQPDCNPSDLRQVAADEAECILCGYRRSLGD